MPYVNLIDYLNANRGTAVRGGERLREGLEPKRKAAEQAAAGIVAPAWNDWDGSWESRGGAKLDAAAKEYGSSYDRLMGSLGYRAQALGPGATARDAWLAGTQMGPAQQFGEAEKRAAFDTQKQQATADFRKRQMDAEEEWKRRQKYSREVDPNSGIRIW